mmetsp:Transcript_23807/g.26984  ORF Transcript_23807/g.26984 Transcript_23807/m.26984 type:complete len:214 (+) Transcript_23807:72-713(+)
MVSGQQHTPRRNGSTKLVYTRDIVRDPYKIIPLVGFNCAFISFFYLVKRRTLPRITHSLKSQNRPYKIYRRQEFTSLKDILLKVRQKQRSTDAPLKMMKKKKTGGGKFRNFILFNVIFPGVLAQGYLKITEFIIGNKIDIDDFSLRNNQAYHDPQGNNGVMVDVLIDLLKFYKVSEDTIEEIKGNITATNDSAIIDGFEMSEIYEWAKAGGDK